MLWNHVRSRTHMGGVEVWRGGLGGAYRLPTLSSVGASLAPPCFRFHTPLIGRVNQASLLVRDIHMGILTDEMKRVVREQRLGYIATVCPDGTPNLSPKGTTRVWDDDHLVFADIRSPQSVRNIEHNPSVEVNVVDPLVRKGYRFKGWGVVHRTDEVFERGCQMYREMGLTLEIRAVVLIRIERALPVTSPAYDRGDTEELVKDRWRKYWRKLWLEVEE